MTIWEFLDYAGDFAAEYDLEITDLIATIYC